MKPKKHKKSIPAKALVAAAEKFVAGTASRRDLVEIGIPARAYPEVSRLAEDERRLFKAKVIQELEAAIMPLVTRMVTEGEKLPISQVAVPLGILLDKYRQLTDTPVVTSQTLNLHLETSREDLLKALLGRQCERLITRPAVPPPAEDPAL